MPMHKKTQDTVRIAKQVDFISHISNKYILTLGCWRSRWAGEGDGVVLRQEGQTVCAPSGLPLDENGVHHVLLSPPPQNHTLYLLLRSGQFQYYLTWGQCMRWGHNGPWSHLHANNGFTVYYSSFTGWIPPGDWYIVSFLKGSLTN